MILLSASIRRNWNMVNHKKKITRQHPWRNILKDYLGKLLFKEWPRIIGNIIGTQRSSFSITSNFFLPTISHRSVSKLILLIVFKEILFKAMNFNKNQNLKKISKFYEIIAQFSSQAESFIHKKEKLIEISYCTFPVMSYIYLKKSVQNVFFS